MAALNDDIFDKQVSQSEEEENSSEFEVDEILDDKYVAKTQKRKYYVSWKGYPGEETWEPEENLTNCIEKLEAYKERKRRLLMRLDTEDFIADEGNSNDSSSKKHGKRPIKTEKGPHQRKRTKTDMKREVTSSDEDEDREKTTRKKRSSPIKQKSDKQIQKERQMKALDRLKEKRLKKQMKKEKPEEGESKKPAKKRKSISKELVSSDESDNDLPKIARHTSFDKSPSRCSSTIRNAILTSSDTENTTDSKKGNEGEGEEEAETKEEEENDETNELKLELSSKSDAGTLCNEEPDMTWVVHERDEELEKCDQEKNKELQQQPALTQFNEMDTDHIMDLDQNEGPILTQMDVAEQTPEESEEASSPMEPEEQGTEESLEDDHQPEGGTRSQQSESSITKERSEREVNNRGRRGRPMTVKNATKDTARKSISDFYSNKDWWKNIDKELMSASQLAKIKLEEEDPPGYEPIKPFNQEELLTEVKVRVIKSEEGHRSGFERGWKVESVLGHSSDQTCFVKFIGIHTPQKLPFDLVMEKAFHEYVKFRDWYDCKNNAWARGSYWDDILERPASWMTENALAAFREWQGRRHINLRTGH